LKIIHNADLEQYWAMAQALSVQPMIIKLETVPASPKRSPALIRAQDRYEVTQKAKERRERYEATDKAKALKAEREKRRPSRAEYRKTQRAKKKLGEPLDNP
jgi:hypothetical protein